MNKSLIDELNSFKDLWIDGYFEGNPLNPMAKSSYGQLGFMSTLHVTYLRCIKPYINSNTVALEIGPGRGAWTKALLPAKEIYALDALPEEHNNFFKYLGHPKHVNYFQIEDFQCRMLPENHFDYMFSFGCLCHVSFDGINEYALNIFSKLKQGSNCFWMIADYDKYNNAVSNLNKLSIWATLMPRSIKHLPFRWFFSHMMKSNIPPRLKMDADNQPRLAGRWYHAGIERTCSMLENVGYQIIDPDVGTCLRDPIIHFTKP